MSINIVTLYQPQYTDGYRNYPMEFYFETKHQADGKAIAVHGDYATLPKEVKAVCDEGSYYILAKETPVYLHDSDMDKERRRQEALGKLSDEERELLGL